MFKYCTLRKIEDVLYLNHWNKGYLNLCLLTRITNDISLLNYLKFLTVPKDMLNFIILS